VQISANAKISTKNYPGF